MIHVYSGTPIDSSWAVISETDKDIFTLMNIKVLVTISVASDGHARYIGRLQPKPSNSK